MATRTQTATQTNHIVIGLHTSLFDRMRDSSILNDEEKSVLLEIEETDSPRTLTYILLHTIQAAIIRLDCRAEEELVIWEKELCSQIQDKLPPGQQVDDYIAEFEKMEDEALRLQELMIATDEAYQSARNQLYANANQINRQIQDQAGETRAAVLNLQRSRLDELGEITERVQAISTREQREARRLESLADAAAAACGRNHAIHQHFLGAAQQAADLVKGIHD